jgi:hypothetical protein
MLISVILGFNMLHDRKFMRLVVLLSFDKESIYPLTRPGERDLI